MREKPGLPAYSRVSLGAWPNARMGGWSERIRTRAFPIEPGLCASSLEFGNIARSNRVAWSVGTVTIARCGFDVGHLIHVLRGNTALGRLSHRIIRLALLASRFGLPCAQPPN